MNEKLSIKDSVTIYLSSFCMMLLSALALLNSGALDNVYISFLLPQAFYIFGIFCYIKFYKKSNLFDIILVTKNGNPLAYLVSLLISFALILSFAIIGVCFSWLLDRFSLSAEITIPKLDNPVSIILSLLVICILPAIGEESMFRGVFLTGLSTKGQRFAVVMSSLIFALSHFNMSQLVYQFIIALFFAFITSSTKNIGYAMVIHFFNNVLALFLPEILPFYNNLAAPSLLNLGILAIMSVVGLVILTFSLPLLFKLAGNQPNKANILQFLFSKRPKSCYNNPEGVSLLIGLVCAMAVVIVLSTLITS